MPMRYRWELSLFVKIGLSQLARVVFGAGDEKRGYRRFAPQVLHPKTEVECGVLAGECIALMKDFFAKKR